MGFTHVIDFVYILIVHVVKVRNACEILCFHMDTKSFKAAAVTFFACPHYVCHDQITSLKGN